MSKSEVLVKKLIGTGEAPISGRDDLTVWELMTLMTMNFYALCGDGHCFSVCEIEEFEKKETERRMSRWLEHESQIHPALKLARR
jgi:hypothetical protein